MITPSKIVAPEHFELFCQINHRKDKEGFDLLTTPDQFPAEQCLKLLKKINSPLLLAGPLLRFNDRFWNATYSPVGKLNSFYIDYARLSRSWLEAFAEASQKNGEWIPFYFADRSYARMKQDIFKTITLVAFDENNEQLIRCPYLQLDYSDFKKQLITCAETFIAFASQLLAHTEASEMKLSVSFQKQLKASIQLEEWIKVLDAIKLIV